MPITFQNLDANESMFFSRELEHIKKRTYDIRYPQLKARQMIPVSYEAGPGARTITYEQYDQVGTMKLIANYADDLPRSDVKGLEFTSPIRSLGGSYGYNVQEVRESAMAGKPLNARKASAVRQAAEQAVDNYAWMANGSATFGGLTGLLYNTNVSKTSATTGVWDSGTTTADQILADVAKAFALIRSNTKGVEMPNTALIPPSQYSWIATTPRSSYSDTTILEFLRKVYPGVSWEQVNQLEAVNPKPSGAASATDVMVLFDRNPDKLTLEIPQEFEQFAPQERNLEFVVPAHLRLGGVIVYYPLSVCILENI